MTSVRSTDALEPGLDLTGLHDLLWSLRRDQRLRERLTEEPAAVAAEFTIDPEMADIVARRDIAHLYGLGVNPYLLFFAALALGVDRATYYGALRDGEPID